MTAPRPLGRSGRWIVALALLCGIAELFGPDLTSGFHRTRRDALDARLCDTLLEQSWLALRGDFAGGLLDDPGYFPARGTRALTEPFALPLLTYLPLRFGGVSPHVAAVSTWIAWTAALYLAAAALLSRTLGTGGWATAAGAYLVAFGAPRAAALSHSQMLLQAPSVLALLALVAAARAGEGGARRALPLAAVAIAAQFWASLYLGWIALFVLALAGGCAMALPAARRGLLALFRRAPLAAVSAALLLALLVAPLAVFYLEARGKVALPPAGAELAQPTPDSWLRLPSGNPLWGRLVDEALPAETGHGWEKLRGIGPVTSLLALSGAFALRRRPLLVSFLAGGACAALLVTRFPGGTSAWPFVVELVPGASLLRAPGRIGHFLLVPAGLALAVALDRIRASRLARTVPAIALLVGLEQATGAVSRPVDDRLRREASIATAMPRDCRWFNASFFTGATAAPQAHPGLYRLDASAAALASGRRSVLGYSGYDPAAFRLWDPGIEDGLSLYWSGRALADWLDETGTPPHGCWVLFREEEDRYLPLVSMSIPAGGRSGPDPVCRRTDVPLADSVLRRIQRPSAATKEPAAAIHADGFENGDLLASWASARGFRPGGSDAVVWRGLEAGDAAAQSVCATMRRGFADGGNRPD